MKSIVLLISIFLFSSCILTTEEIYIYDQYVYVKGLNVISNERGNLKLHLKVEMPTVCHQFHRREIKQNRDTIFVRYFSKVRKDEVCIFLYALVDLHDNFKLEPSRSYYFRFYAGDGITLDTLIYLKN